MGFVADAGGKRTGDVLALALAGLAALGHRGAVAADGELSDGAGVSLPLEPAVIARVAGPGAGRPGVVFAFLPRGGTNAVAGRLIVETALACEGIPLERWRSVPVRPAVLGPEARASRPSFRQAIVPRPARMSDEAFEVRLVSARRRMEEAAREAGLTSFSIASASCRTIVYKGLVAGGLLGSLYPDLDDGPPVSYAIFHQRYATNTHPSWRLAQPFRLIAHNGEINTVRGNREQLRGRRLDPLPSTAARRLAAAGSLVSPDGSDSLSLDETLELLTLTGWSLPGALVALLPEALALRLDGHPLVAALARRSAGFLAPWDGPAALVWGDGTAVGALLDRNGLRPAAYARTKDGLVALTSEAGAIPLPADQTIIRGRLGPGEMLLVEPRRHLVLEDAEAKVEALRRAWVPDGAWKGPADEPLIDDSPASDTPAGIRYLLGLDAERYRLHLRSMAIDAREPLWSMGDDTPTPGHARIARQVTDHLRQSFAQVTNPPIDPERERAVLDLSIVLGRRQPLLGGMPRARPSTMHLRRPFVADGEVLAAGFPGRVRWLDATWDPTDGPAGLPKAVERLATAALAAARRGVQLLMVSDRRANLDRMPIPSVLAVGRVHTALTDAGMRGRTDVAADASDILDVHAAAMALAAGATVVAPRLAVELATELAGGRGAEGLTAEQAIANLLDAFEGGLRKTLARMGISTAASYVGGALFEALELDMDVTERCFPAAPTWPGSIGWDALARRIMERRQGALVIEPATPPNRLRDPGLARFRGDGELHLYAPAMVGRIQDLVANADDTAAALAVYRAGVVREPAVARDGIALRSVGPAVDLSEVEPATSIIRRFVASAMSVGALSPEAHQAVTIGIQRAGGAANTGEGGEDPAWYTSGSDGRRHDARIKQVASARFGVTAHYLTRADQLEIKIAQGSKPGEGGHLPGRKASAYIASLRRGLPGQDYISPPPHHDIYSIEDLAQLITDLRAINPVARIGVKLVATRGIGTIAAGVAKAGADYIHVAGHAGGTGASPLSSIKHVGSPWELGLAEVHQVLLRNGLRDQVALRTDGGLQTGRDVVVAAMLGAEEFGFGTALLVALGCDMARQCHLDTCPTGIATQRDDLRAKFAGSPEQVERFVTLIAEDVRRELAGIGARSIGEIVGRAAVGLKQTRTSRTFDLRAVLDAPEWSVGAARRSDPTRASRVVSRSPASAVEEAILDSLRKGGTVGDAPIALSTADRSFGAGLSGAVERGEIGRPVQIALHGAAGQSFGAFVTAGIELRLSGVANDYVAKGLSGGTVIVNPESELAAEPESQAIVGNTCLYGATAGRLHIVGRAGMRFAVRNSGATAVVEGVGPHGCEYMTGGVVVVLGPVGANFGAGMTGGRAYIIDRWGRRGPGLATGWVVATRLSVVARDRPRGADLIDELGRLLADHAAAGSIQAERIMAAGIPLDEVWVVEPIAIPATTATEPQPSRPIAVTDIGAGDRYGGQQPDGILAAVAPPPGP